MKLTARICLACCVPLALFALGAGLATRAAFTQRQAAMTREGLERSRVAAEVVLEEAQRRLVAAGQMAAASPELKAALALRDPAASAAAAADAAMNLRHTLRVDGLWIADAQGRLIAHVQAAGALPVSATSTAEDQAFAMAVRPGGAVSLGVMDDGASLAVAATGPLMNQEKMLGAIRATLAIDGAMVERLSKAARLPVAFVSGGRVLAGGLDPKATQALERALAQSKIGSGEASLDGPGGQWLAWVAPLADPRGGGRVAMVVMAPLGEASKPPAALWFTLVAALAVALGLSVVLALMAGLPLQRAVGRFAAACKAREAGAPSVHFEAGASAEGRELAEGFARLNSPLASQDQANRLLGRALPGLPAALLTDTDAKAAAAGECREIVVLIADLQGFTRVQEQMAPTETLSLLNGFFDRAAQAVKLEGGVCDHNVGDAFVAVWGAPLPDAEAATKAARAGLALQDAMAAWNRQRAQELKDPITLAIGIGMGQAVTGNLGPKGLRAYTAVGDAVSMSKKLCSKAAPGQILVPEAAYRQIRWLFELNRVEALTIKELSQPVQVYEILGMRQEPLKPE